MPIELMPHQLEDATFLAHKEMACLWSGTGTGKTHTALHAVELVLSHTPDARVLILPPAAVCSMWAAEAGAFLNTSVTRLRKAADDLAPAQITVVSHGLVVRVAEKLRAAGPWDIIIVDEAHAFKTLSAERTRALYGGGATRRTGIAHGARYIWPLSGTPITRYADDLYPHFRALFPWIIGNSHRLGDMAGPRPMTLEEFQNRYCQVELRDVPNRRNPVRTVVGNRDEDDLRILVDETSRRRTLEEVAPDLPPLLIDREELDLDPVRIAQAMDGAPQLRELVARFTAETISAEDVVIALQQLEGEHIATARRQLGLLKVQAVATRIIDILDEAPEKILVFGWHPDVLNQIAWKTHGYALGSPQATWLVKAGSVIGATDLSHRDEAILDFNEGDLDVLAAQMLALGVGVNLQAQCSRVLIAEPDWAGTTMTQAIGRVRRMGQTEPQRVTFLNAPGTPDDAVTSVATAKLRGSAQILGD